MPTVTVGKCRHSFFEKAGGDLAKAKAKAKANATTFAREEWLARFAPSPEDLQWFMPGCPSLVDGKLQLLLPYGPAPAETIEKACKAATHWAKTLGRLPADAR